jgi:hypothetical protein
MSVRPSDVNDVREGNPTVSFFYSLIHQERVRAGIVRIDSLIDLEQISRLLGERNASLDVLKRATFSITRKLATQRRSCFPRGP